MATCRARVIAPNLDLNAIGGVTVPGVYPSGIDVLKSDS
ncbi:unnamed protein product, partial [marine sediment metagenome]